MSEKTPPAPAKGTHYVLRLFITGTTSRSSRAIANLRRVCEERLHGEYDLEVVDIYQHPAAAREYQTSLSLARSFTPAQSALARLKSPLAHSG